MLFGPGSSARFLAFAFVFFAEGFGLELVPISCEIFESVILKRLALLSI